MKKTIRIISLALVVVALSVLLTSCNSVGNMYAKDMKYFNKKAIDNIESLIGRSPDEYEDWVFETYSHDDLVASKPNEHISVETYKSYISKDKAVRVDFFKDDNSSDIYLCVYPYMYTDDSIAQWSGTESYLVKVASRKYYKEVTDFRLSSNPDYKKAPLITQVEVHNISNPDKAELNLGYFMNESGKWLYLYDGSEQVVDFIYKNGTFVAKN